MRNRLGTSDRRAFAVINKYGYKIYVDRETGKEDCDSFIKRAESKAKELGGHCHITTAKGLMTLDYYLSHLSLNIYEERMRK